MPTGMAAAAILILMENPAYLLGEGVVLKKGKKKFNKVLAK